MQQVHEGYASAKKFFNHGTATSYDSVVKLTTFGRDHEWKGAILEIVKNRKRVLDLASGTGILSSMLEMSGAHHGRMVTGLDLTFDYISMAKRKHKISFINGTAELLPYKSEYFDAVVSSYLAKYIDVEKVIRECWRILQPGGSIVFHDFAYPQSRTMRFLWCTYFQILKLIGIFASNWQVVFNDLSPVVKNSKWIEQTMEQLSRQGFQDINCRCHTFGTAAIIYASKPW